MATPPTPSVTSTPGYGISVGGKIYVWSEALDEQSLARKQLRRVARDSVNGAALVLAAICLLWFGWSAYLSQAATIWSAMWRPSAVGLSFSLMLLFGAFVFERMCEVARRRYRIPERARGAELPEIVAPVPEGERSNVGDLYQGEAIRAVEEAYALAARFGHSAVHPLHLFITSLSHGDVPVVFGRLGIRFDDVREPLNRRLLTLPVGDVPSVSPESEQVLLASFVNAYARHRSAVSVIEVFYEAYQQDAFIRELFYDLKVDEARIANVVEWIRISDTLRERYDLFRRAAAFKPTGPMNRAMTAVQTPSLDAVGEDLTTAAVAGRLPPLIGREREMEELFRVIEAGGKSIVLVGPEGAGKTAIVSGIAEQMVRESVPKVLEDKRLVSIVLPALMGGVNPSEAQARLLAALSDVAKARNVVLVIQNIEQMTEDLAQILTDVLSRRITFVIATTTPEAYVNVVEHSILSRVLERVNVPEPDIATAIHVVESKVGGIEYEQNVIFTYDAVERSVTLSDRYIHASYLPKKAIEICREAALVASKARGANALVGGEDVERVLMDKTGIPMTQVTTDERQKLLALEERIHGRVIGQDEAVKAVSSALRRARAELRAENRPIATFLFLGPSGVGKTALAKAVAASYFGGENAMLRFDMSEYQDQASVYRLIGAPGGEAGLLTEAIRRNPFALILLDEFEKAHPNILNLFLQVFDEGRLTDSSGRTVDFTNAIIIVTSNAGTAYIQDATKAGVPTDQMKTHLLEEELRGIYRPELLNRFDGVIVFRPLTEDEVQQIAYLMVAQVAERLETKGIKFRATDEAVQALAKKGYDPKFGARPLRRIIQEEVDNAIATALLEGRVDRRDTVVLHPDGQIEIEKAEAL
ncbi:hypothetical protein A2348_02840 [Candidatus Uhrbacteria bacterium RIFOXYB12_FULL_58_10]|nr:MAG: hypothetical protein A2348_02840 [Candidatus Uhrbacteria bacterium RIFOXYB12_FULL_58_10]